MKPQPGNGAQRTCPYCGQKAVFSHRVPVPRRVQKSGVSATSTPEYQPGWICENVKCAFRYDTSG